MTFLKYLSSRKSSYVMLEALYFTTTLRKISPQKLISVAYIYIYIHTVGLFTKTCLSGFDVTE